MASTSSPTSSPTEAVHTEQTHELVGIGSILFVLIILITLFSGKLVAIFRLHYLTESTISIIFGVIIGIITTCMPHESPADIFSFDSEFFFYVLLPPIVFEAGFSLKRKHFFKNVGSILIFAILGTVISCIIIASGLYFLSFIGIIPSFSGIECLLFGALISAVDPVGTLSVLGNKELNIDPTLYSLIFGESVLNDAVSIVLYKIFNNVSQTTIIVSFESHFLHFIGQFLGIFIGSFLLGILIALICAAILRHVLHLLVVEDSNTSSNARSHPGHIAHRQQEDNGKETQPRSRLTVDTNLELEAEPERERVTSTVLLKEEDNGMDQQQDIIYLDEYRHNEESHGESPSLEFAIVILFAYLSYNLGEVLSLSGIVSVFSCGIAMSHYAWYNLTWIAQLAFHHIIVAISKCCENFVYVYLGISTVLSITPSIEPTYRWNGALIFFMVVLCFLSRAANIFPLSYITNLRRRIKISHKMQIMIWFAGLRGAIAFALALSINTPHSDLIVTTTLSIVIITTVLLGCTTKCMLDKLQLNDPSQRAYSGASSLSISHKRHPRGHTFSPPESSTYQALLHSSSSQNEQQSADIPMHEDDVAMTLEPSPVASTKHKLQKQRPQLSPRQVANAAVGNTQMGRIRHMLRRQYEDGSVHKYWHKFDTNYMQKYFGGSSNPFSDDRNIGIFSNRQQQLSMIQSNRASDVEHMEMEQNVQPEPRIEMYSKPSDKNSELTR